MRPGKRTGLRGCVTDALCLCSTPLLADQVILRCDSPKAALSFSVLVDPANRSVLNIGFGSKIETEQFSETVIAATDKDSDVSQNLIIDRVTGQFQLTWGPSKTGEKGRSIRASVRPPGESLIPA